MPEHLQMVVHYMSGQQESPLDKTNQPNRSGLISPYWSTSRPEAAVTRQLNALESNVVRSGAVGNGSRPSKENLVWRHSDLGANMLSP